jgi:hypothetical protein
MLTRKKINKFQWDDDGIDLSSVAHKNASMTIGAVMPLCVRGSYDAD